eukprot:2424062-Amphidinium_carterae.1
MHQDIDNRMENPKMLKIVEKSLRSLCAFSCTHICASRSGVFNNLSGAVVYDDDNQNDAAGCGCLISGIVDLCFL